MAIDDCSPLFATICHLFATIRTIRDYSLFPIRDYWLFAIRPSGFPDTLRVIILWGTTEFGKSSIGKIGKLKCI